MNSARRTITSGNRIREVDLYSGFNKNVANLYEQNEDEAYQNALKVSSYGKRNTTPKTNWVSSPGMVEADLLKLFLSDRRAFADRRDTVDGNDASETLDCNPTGRIFIGNADVRSVQSGEQEDGRAREQKGGHVR